MDAWMRHSDPATSGNNSIFVFLKNRSDKKKLKKISNRSKSPQLQDNSVRTIETLHFVTKHPQQDKIEQKSKNPDISEKTPIKRTNLDTYRPRSGVVSKQILRCCDLHLFEDLQMAHLRYEDVSFVDVRFEDLPVKMFDWKVFDLRKFDWKMFDLKICNLRGLIKPHPPALLLNKTSSLMLQVEVFKTRLPGILGDNEIHHAASCTMLDLAASHV